MGNQLFQNYTVNDKTNIVIGGHNSLWKIY